MLDTGQWATPVPVWASSRSSWSLKWMPWAYHTSFPSQPQLSIYARGRMPTASRVKFSSSLVSHRWVCSRTPMDRASTADCFSRSVVTLKGEHGASATWRMENRDVSWNFSTSRWLSFRMVSTS